MPTLAWSSCSSHDNNIEYSSINIIQSHNSRLRLVWAEYHDKKSVVSGKFMYGSKLISTQAWAVGWKTNGDCLKRNSRSINIRWKSKLRWGFWVRTYLSWALRHLIHLFVHSCGWQTLTKSVDESARGYLSRFNATVRGSLSFHMELVWNEWWLKSRQRRAAGWESQSILNLSRL